MQRTFCLSWAWIVLALGAATLSHPVAAADADPAVQKIFTKLIAAIEAKDRAAFVADATDAVREGTTEAIMELISEQLGTRLKKGYTATYFGQLKVQGHEVHLWKLAFKDGGDDLIARIAMKDGKVAGFFIVP